MSDSWRFLSCLGMSQSWSANRPINGSCLINIKTIHFGWPIILTHTNWARGGNIYRCQLHTTSTSCCISDHVVTIGPCWLNADLRAMHWRIHFIFWNFLFDQSLPFYETPSRPHILIFSKWLLVYNVYIMFIICCLYMLQINMYVCVCLLLLLLLLLLRLLLLLLLLRLLLLLAIGMARENLCETNLE